MAKVIFTPIIKWFTGSIDKMVFRRSHNGKVSVYPSPDMSTVNWSQAQKDHRQRMGEASGYASAAVADPELRPIYVQMAETNNMNKERPFDMAVKDYYHTGNHLLWKKHMNNPAISLSIRTIALQSNKCSLRADSWAESNWTNHSLRVLRANESRAPST
jgi:hypothetical protein